MQRAKRQQYSPTKMARAIDYVRGGMAKKAAAKLCGVPRTTLLDKLYGRVPETHTKPGPKPTLTSAEEGVLVNYIKLMAEVGYPVSRLELKKEVKKLLDRDGRKTLFNDNMPGDDWYDSFCKRHPEIKEKKPQALGKERAIISEEMVESWFRFLTEYLENDVKDHDKLVKDPRRIFNADESGFPLCATTGRVLAPTGAKHVYQVVNYDKTQITVMACMNANGDYMPPLIVYPGQRFRDVGISGFPGAIYGHSDKGWMDSELFVQFLHEFLAFVKSKSITFPVILFVDGHSTHLSLEAAQFCQDNEVILYCLLPNATHILQACDIGLFSPLKTAWKAQLKTWQVENIGCVVTKSVFPGLFYMAWDRVATLHNAAQGFKRSGLFPLGAGNVDKSKLGPSKLLSPPDHSPNLCDSRSPPLSTPDHSYALLTDKHVLTQNILLRNDSVISNQSADASNISSSNITEASDALRSGCSEISYSECDFMLSDCLIDCDLVSHTEIVSSQTDQLCEIALESDALSNPNIAPQASPQISPAMTMQSTDTERRPLEPLVSNNSSVRLCPPTPQCSSFLTLPPARNPKNPAYISPVFDSLTIPEIKQKAKRKTMREKLPKAVSGHEAIKMLKEREEKKKNEERLKKERKAERERKRVERELLKERKKKEREEKKKLREALRKAKQSKKKQSKRKRMSDSSSEEENIKITYADSDDADMSDIEPSINCFVCKDRCWLRADIPRDWVDCVICERKWHVKCTDNLILQSLQADELEDHEYFCDDCVTGF